MNVNDATGGWTTSDVQAHRHDATIRAHLATADLVTLDVGANDFNLDPSRRARLRPSLNCTQPWTSGIVSVADKDSERRW